MQKVEGSSPFIRLYETPAPAGVSCVRAVTRSERRSPDAALMANQWLNVVCESGDLGLDPGANHLQRHLPRVYGLGVAIATNVCGREF